jgi:hypothetical protein
VPRPGLVRLVMDLPLNVDLRKKKNSTVVVKILFDILKSSLTSDT